VSRAVVVARHDWLVAYLTTVDGTVPAGLFSALPPYLVPAIVHVLDELPLTPNGKIDRAALPDVALPTGETSPRSRLESEVAGIVASVLGVDAVGVHDDFFALGGHSLLLVRLAAELRRALGSTLPVAALFSAPTVAALTRLISSGAPGGDALAPVVTLQVGMPSRRSSACHRPAV
jgi:acyl carrier protein